jgi:hypothetical protein
MTKKIVKILSIVSSVLVLVILYLSIFGIETLNFNDQIKKKILENKKGINLDLKAVKMTLSPFDLTVNIKTLDTGIIFNSKRIGLESLKAKISLLKLFNNQHAIENLQISSKSSKVKNLVSLVRSAKNDLRLLYLEMMIKDGYIKANIDLNFDKNGKIKNDYKVNGSVKKLKINVLKNYDFNSLNFIFDVKEKKYTFLKIDTQLNDIKLSSPSIKVEEKNNLFLINGKVLNVEKDIPFNTFKKLLNNSFVNLKSIYFVSESDFSLDINKNFKVNNLNISSEINLSKLTYKNNYKFIQKYFPEIKELINLKNHKIKLNYNKDRIKIEGVGKVLIEDNEDKINYEITKNKNQFYFKNILEIKQNNFLINELNYKKEKDKKVIIKIDGILKDNNNFFFKQISLIENNNTILVQDLNLDNKLMISDVRLIELNYENSNNIHNQIYLKKDKKNYTIEGESFDASKLINKMMRGNENNSSIFSNLNSTINLKIKKTYIDDISFINNLSGIVEFNNNNINNLSLVSIFPNKKKLQLRIHKNEKNEKITHLFTGHPKPLIKRYDFIKGFEEGYLDFYSVKKDGVSDSVLVIDNFKVKEVPVFAKLLSLASLQGIADLLTGEGIRFTDFEMRYSSQKGLTKIEEMYAIGPAISILMDGYIESKKLVSLRGTLVPATTINRSIASIPLLGKILIGDKTGEGVFGVSFKIKGPPKNLSTTVNPIKTLTPRFITRTLEKIKKN